MVGKIRALTFDDEDEIVELIRTCIFNGDDLHVGELVANDSNVWAFYKLEIFTLIFENDPIFGYFENSKLLGFTCCSTKINKMYKLKKSIAIGMITMTHPNHRKKGIGSKLRVSLAKACQLKGIDKFIFEIKQENTASLHNAQKIAQNLQGEANLVSFKFEGNTNVF